jgi:hypothetical protein
MWYTHELVGLIKMCLNDTCHKVCTGKYMSDGFLVQNDLV